MRPCWRPARTSLAVRSPVDAGRSEYSAVTQPVPWPDIQRGTPSSIEAAQSTRVLPCEKSAQPCGSSRKSGTMSSGLSSSGRLPGGLLGGEDQGDSPPEHPLEDRPDQRVVRAAEDDGVAPGLLDRDRVF